MVRHRVYKPKHIRPLAVRPLTHPESVQNPWGIFISGPHSQVPA